jgi:hypothetical protein
MAKLIFFLGSKMEQCIFLRVVGNQSQHWAFGHSDGSPSGGLLHSRRRI